MFIDHLAGHSLLQTITTGGFFFTSAAEGFVFIAGFIAAVVYRRQVSVHGLRTTCLRILMRAAQLYLLSLLLTLLVLPISEYFGAGPCGTCPRMGIEMNEPLRLLWAIVTMQQTYYLVDIPLLYTRLFLLAPIALVLLTAGKTWLLTAISVGIWAVHQIAPTRALLGWTVADNTVFHLAAWQLIFFGGMVLGYHRANLSRLIRREAYAWWLGAAGLGSAALVVLYKVDTLGLSGIPSDVQAWLFSKPEVGLGRLLASAFIFTFLFLATHTFWTPLQRATGWLLLPLGRHALNAYTAHVLLGLALVSLEGVSGRLLTGTAVASAALQIGAIAVTWLCIHYRLPVLGRLGQHFVDRMQKTMSAFALAQPIRNER
jgi:hypothetical protein